MPSTAAWLFSTITLAHAPACFTDGQCNATAGQGQQAGWTSMCAGGGRCTPSDRKRWQRMSPRRLSLVSTGYSCSCMPPVPQVTGQLSQVIGVVGVLGLLGLMFLTGKCMVPGSSTGRCSYGISAGAYMIAVQPLPPTPCPWSRRSLHILVHWCAAVPHIDIPGLAQSSSSWFFTLLQLTLPCIWFGWLITWVYNLYTHCRQARG